MRENEPTVDVRHGGKRPRLVALKAPGPALSKASGPAPGTALDLEALYTAKDEIDGANWTMDGG